jgi:hypothetical protein
MVNREDMLEIDGEPAIECAVCDTVWGMHEDAKAPDVWRFDTHWRTHFPKGKKPFDGPCEGSHLTFEEAWDLKRQMRVE